MYLDFGGIYRLKNFIHLRDFSKEEINHIFELADKIKAHVQIQFPQMQRMILKVIKLP